MRVDIREIPRAIRRRVAQHVESLRDTEMGHGTDTAYLGEQVCIMYRPDIDQPAYYEFEILGTGRPHRTWVRPDAAPDSDRDDTQPRGFIVASAGPHDFPIPHFSYERSPISVLLAAQAAERNLQVARIYKLDALSYIAEDDKEHQVAQVGQMPGLVRGLPNDLSQMSGKINSFEQAEARGKDDGRVSKRDRGGRFRGPRKPPKLDFVLEAHWPMLKAGYEASFGPFLDALARDAARAWRIDELAAEFGEGIMTGSNHRVALLGELQRAALTGPGADRVRLTVRERSKRARSVALSVGPEAVRRELPFQLQLAYEGGSGEELNFFLVSPTTPSNFGGRLKGDVDATPTEGSF